ncbi:hypothetical protein VNO78_23724 [Psophocarpus tetragonolobus]|uniref:Calmodulin-binding domain-containing protein n=1 Tax=Psophocarpus tetragonolobus TaxID=3891 RepID=A0AAN9S4N5_PSOTE
MAEESTINQRKSEKIEVEDSDEKTKPNEGLTITKVPPKILSRYLSARKSSCHDLCKYGIPHAVEAKQWVSKRERKIKVPQENITSLEGTRKSGSSSKPSQTSNFEKVNSPIDTKEVTYEKAVTSEKNSAPFDETRVSSEHNSDLKKAQGEPSLPVKDSSNSTTKREIVKKKSPSDSSSRKETESSKQKKVSLTGGKEKPTPSSLHLSSKHNVKKPQSLSSKSSKNVSRESSLKSNENVEEVEPELTSSDILPDKILHVTEPASAKSSEDPTVPCDATKLSSPSPSSSGDKSSKHTNKKTGKSEVSSSSMKGHRYVAGNKGKINMQHKTRSISQSPSLSPSVSPPNSSLGKQNNATYKSNKRGHGQGENVKVGYKMRQKMSTKVWAANKVVAAWKLNFRRGKVIELQPQSNNIPRRLKFRPARILGDDMWRDINGARKRGIVYNKVGGSGEINGANTKSEKVGGKLHSVEGSKRRIIVERKVGGDRSKIEGSKSGSETVVLKHQNVEGKKQNPRLYNNVIEETATMLAELRKSKVKALVGAFETVISLDSAREATAAEVSTTS